MPFRTSRTYGRSGRPGHSGGLIDRGLRGRKAKRQKHDREFNQRQAQRKEARQKKKEQAAEQRRLLKEAIKKRQPHREHGKNVLDSSRRNEKPSSKATRHERGPNRVDSSAPAPKKKSIFNVFRRKQG